MEKKKGKVDDVKEEKEEGDKKEDESDPTPSVGLFELFKFASPMDTFLIVVALTIAFGCGSFIPIFTILFGDTLQAFTEDAALDNMNQMTTATPSDTTLSPPPSSDVMDTLTRFGLGMIGMAFLMWFLSYIFVSCLNLAAANQVFRIRGKFIQAVLKQDVSWYDTNTSSDFASRMTEDLNKLQEGIGEKIGMLCFFAGTFLFSIIIAFIYGWDLTLVILSMMPLMVIFGGLAALAQSKFAEKEMEAYGKAGALAEEVLSAIRTVVAFGGQKKEISNYEENLKDAKKSGILRGLLTGLSGGLTFGIMWAVYGLGFWYGIKRIMDDREGPECTLCNDLFSNGTYNAQEAFDCASNCLTFQPKDMLVVFFSVLIGGFQLGQAAPYVEALATARSAAGKIYSIIDRVPDIDSSSEEGQKPQTLQGNIEFQNVFFNYPSRPDVKIMQGFSLAVPRGKTVALVGSSGCGKSTCIQLVQRFYDPEVGSVKVDGINIKDLNIGWLRDHIGIVGQEPVLFDLTIRENIRLGNPNATDQDIEKACKEANAFNFIEKLPRGLDTLVGEGGTQMSGGQKQRIAIARALIRNPQILLLDEATSALDTESEKVVQDALDKARAGRTTLVVAHRLTTIRTADIIVAIEEGKVKEKGTHDELMAKEGLYHSLVMRQTQGKLEAEETQLEKKDEKEVENEQIDTIKLEEVQTKSAKRKGMTLVDGKKEEDELPKIQISRLLKRNSPEWFYISIGAIASFLMGATMPIFSILFGDVLGVLGYADTTKAREESVQYALMFCGLALYSLLAMLLQGWMFAISGENLTKRLRRDAFEAMLKQEMGWYDLQENNTGSLCARLSGDAAKVQGATGARVGSILQGISGIVLAIALGLYFNWKLGLVCSVFFPLMIGATMAEMMIVQGVDTIEVTAFEQSAKLAIEAITNIRTVAGLRVEAKYVQMYIDLLAEPHKLTLKKSHFRGFIFGLSQAMQFFAWGTTMWYGGYLVENEGVLFEDVFKVTNAVIGGAGMVGYSFAFTADFNKAMVAAARVFQLLDRKPLIDTNPSAGLKLNQVDGNVKLKEAQFTYPTRQNIQILNRLNLSIKTGESIALVGESGCGKSTVIQLIQRFYDLNDGSLELEGNNIQALNLPYVRSKLGIVSQEPVLFDRSIVENIKYGDNERTVSMEEVIDAARKANIHNFVAALPQGYDTKVGGKGTQLSGGQKQRVAIARALVRNPRILLLDEATSALDTESEKVVQDALDAAQVGRTSITIAHRLSTIKGADQIYIIKKGKMTEHGTHDQLLEAQGDYYKMWNNNVS